VALVDARKLADTRYTEHNMFNQQIAIADIVVGNKQYLYQAGDQQTLTNYLREHGAAKAQVFFAQHGDISAIDLIGATTFI
jgi:G3E family GTPase